MRWREWFSCNIRRKHCLHADKEYNISRIEDFILVPLLSDCKRSSRVCESARYECCHCERSWWKSYNGYWLKWKEIDQAKLAMVLLAGKT
jgi:hypothetical protein